MTRHGEGDVTLQLTVVKPPRGVAHSLQDKDNTPIDVRMSTGRDIRFEVGVRLEEGKAGWRFLGDFVRTEGKTRRFIYVCIGQGASQTDTPWSRRAKVDLPDITPAMIRKAKAGQLVLKGAYAGTDRKGEPACATVNPVWSVAE